MSRAYSFFNRLNYRTLFVWLALGLVIATLSLAWVNTARAVDAAKREPCVTDTYSLGYKSPFSATPDQCLGLDSAHSFYQFAVELPVANSTASIVATNGNGQTIPFVKQSGTLYVSKPSDTLGYQATGMRDSGTCNANDKNYQISITARAAGVTQTIPINLCENRTSYVIAKSADKLDTADNGSVVASTTGCIEGTLGIVRDDTDPNWTAEQRNAKTQLGAISTVKVDGPSSYNLTNSSQVQQAAKDGWLTLEDGNLKITKLKPGSYTVTIVYNDKIQIVEDIGAGTDVWTSGAVTFKSSPSPLLVKASSTCSSFNRGEALWISSSTGNTATPVTSDDLDAVVATSTCDIEGIGWLVCPVVHFMSNVVDAAYAGIVLLLDVPPLEVDPAKLASSGDPLYNAWKISRNLANIAFIIVFLIIIYSQVTSVGITNYGLKRLLPKLIIAAILVNLSYWICALAVDTSNVLGHSIKVLFENVNLGTGNSSGFFDGTTISDDSIFSSIAGFVLVSAGVAGTAAFSYAGIAIFLPLLIAALIAVFVVFILLTLRQAFIILAIVVAPLAFVAYLLPNTEVLYKKWFGLFKTLLLLFPIIAAVFGGAKLAGTIVMRSSDNLFVDIAGASMMIIPLFVVPAVLKSVGGILGKIGGMLNNPNKGPIDSMKKGAEGFRKRQENRRAIQSMSGRKIFGGGGRFRRKARTKAIDSNLERERTNQEQQSVAREATRDDGSATVFGRKLAGAGPLGGGADAAAIQRALAGASITIDEAVAKDIKAESVMVRDMDATALKDILGSSTASEERKAAAMQRLVKISDPGDSVDSNGNITRGYASEVNDALGDNSSNTLRRATAEALATSGPGFLKASDIDMFATGSHRDEQGNRSTLQSVARFNVDRGVYSQEKLVEETSANLQFAFEYATPGSNGGQQRMVNTAAALKQNDNLNGKIKHNVKAIDNLSVAQAPNTP